MNREENSGESRRVRIQKFLSEQGICSRRQAEDWIKEGKLRVDGKKSTLGDKVTGKELMTLEGKKLVFKSPEKVVFAFYKPIGVESTLQNEHGGKTLSDFHFGTRVFPIGRLDKDSRGLLLLTNDGELGNKLAHPRYEHEKEYLVGVDKTIAPVIIQKLSSGRILLDRKRVAPCLVEKLDSKHFKIILREGRNRQIRRMCDVCGLLVTDLFRVRVGSLLVGEMKPGEFRKLTAEEMKTMKSGE